MKITLADFHPCLADFFCSVNGVLGKNPLPISLFSYCYFQIKFPPFLERHPARWTLLLTIWLKVAFCWNNSTYLVTQFYDQTTTEKRKGDVFVIGHNCRVFLKRRPKTPWTQTKTPWTRTKTPWTKTKTPRTKTKTPWTETKTSWTKTKTPWTKTKTPWTKMKTPWTKTKTLGLTRRPHGLK